MANSRWLTSSLMVMETESFLPETLTMAGMPCRVCLEKTASSRGARADNAFVGSAGEKYPGAELDVVFAVGFQFDF